jgi:hypothetical protein
MSPPPNSGSAAGSASRAAWNSPTRSPVVIRRNNSRPAGDSLRSPARRRRRRSSSNSSPTLTPTIIAQGHGHSAPNGYAPVAFPTAGTTCRAGVPRKVRHHAAQLDGAGSRKADALAALGCPAAPAAGPRAGPRVAVEENLTGVAVVTNRSGPAARFSWRESIEPGPSDAPHRPEATTQRPGGEVARPLEPAHHNAQTPRITAARRRPGLGPAEWVMAMLRRKHLFDATWPRR